MSLEELKATVIAAASSISDATEETVNEVLGNILAEIEFARSEWNGETVEEFSETEGD